MSNQKVLIKELDFLSLFEAVEQYHLTIDSFDDYLTGIYQIVKKQLYFDDFYIVLDKSDQLDFLKVLQKEQGLAFDRYSQLMPDQEVSPIAWIIFQRLEKVFLKTDLEWGTQLGVEQWLGFPLLNKQGRCFGVLIVENDNGDLLYSEEQISVLRVIASYITFGIEYFLENSAQEHRELSNTQILKQQIRASTHAEKLQQVLYEIASLANAQIPLSEMYQKIHQHIDTIIDARNFCIATYEEGEVTFAYVVDQEGGEQHRGKTFAVGDGLNSYIVRNGKSTMFTQASVHRLLKEGELWNVMGSEDFSCWIGAPITYEGVMYGVISVQSYIDYSNILYTQADLDLLEFIAGHVAAVMQAHKKSDQLRKTRTELMRKYLIEEQQNQQLVTALKELKETQLKVIHREKMMSLSGVVAGIAHEINTPLGTCITSVSHSENINLDVQQQLLAKQLSAHGLSSYAKKRQQAVSLVDNNMQKVEQLMDQFKNMTAEHSEKNIRSFDLKELLEEVISSMQTVLKPAGHQVNLSCPENLILNTAQSAVQRVVLNLILNSIHHAYGPSQIGCLRLSVEAADEKVILRFSDGGKGMRQADLDKLFDPFFTTKRRFGAGGLGAHQIYHLTVTTLSGELQVSCPQGVGLYYKITFPISLSDFFAI